MTKKIGFLFPGQGSQFIGMGSSLFNNFASAKSVFERANNVLGYDLAKICFEGPEDLLTRTLNAQPAIYTSSFAALTVFKEKFPGVKSDIVAGHSLGEFSALAAAGFFSFEDGLRLVQVRAQAMEKAATANPGTMAAILGLEQQICAEVAKNAGAEVANYNSPLQTVLTGTQAAITQSITLAEQAGAKRAMQLKVSGAFHSSLMKSAQAELLAALEKIQVHPLNCGFIPNVTGDLNSNVSEIRTMLGQQLVSSVRWTDTMKKFAQQNLTHLFEIGPGKVLKGLAKSCEVPVAVQTFGVLEDIEPTTKILEGVIHA